MLDFTTVRHEISPSKLLIYNSGLFSLLLTITTYLSLQKTRSEICSQKQYKYTQGNTVTHTSYNINTITITHLLCHHSFGYTV